MKKILLPLLLALAGAAQAEPIEALQPMAFWAGYCWTADMPVAGQTDTHCFRWLYGGRALRDEHTVRTPGKPDYVGETTYFYDSVAKTVEYVYIENMGGISRGRMETAADGLSFPATDYTNAGHVLPYRVKWTRTGADSYEAFSEMKPKDAWLTQFKAQFKRGKATSTP